MLQAFVFNKVGVVVGDIYFVDPYPHSGQEGPEHGVRLELRVFDRGTLKGSIYSAIPISAGKPIWRVDLLEAVDGKPGSFNRTHHHPKFDGRWDPAARHFERELSADPLGWLGSQLADLPGILDRAEVPRDIADPSDAASLKEMAPAIVSAASMMLDKVRAGELGRAPQDGAADATRSGWVKEITPAIRSRLKELEPAVVSAASMMLDKVRVRVLGRAPQDGAAAAIRSGWL
jgi:hypothetical protein